MGGELRYYRFNGNRNCVKSLQNLNYVDSNEKSPGRSQDFAVFIKRVIRCYAIMLSKVLFILDDLVTTVFFVHPTANHITTTTAYDTTDNGTKDTVLFIDDGTTCRTGSSSCAC